MCVFDNNNKLKGMSSIAAFSYQIKAESEPSSIIFKAHHSFQNYKYDFRTTYKHKQSRSAN